MKLTQILKLNWLIFGVRCCPLVPKIYQDLRQGTIYRVKKLLRKSFERYIQGVCASPNISRSAKAQLQTMSIEITF